MHRKRLLNSIYLATFFFTLHYAFLVYINSSFLESVFPAASAAEIVSVVYSVGALISIALLSEAPAVFRAWGLARTTIFYFILLALASVGLGITTDPVVAVILFIALMALQTVLRYVLDVYVETFSKDEATGQMRGIFLTVINSAIAISPILVGMLITRTSFSTVYLLSGVMVLVGLLAISQKLSQIPERHHHDAQLIPAFKKVLRRPNVYKIMVLNILLELFFAWMTIYTPLYLTQTFGFGWNELGIIFTIMLLPFVIFELPAGYLADKLLGEKEILSFGLLIMAVSTGVIAYFHATTILPWAILLFITRIGASLVEIMTDTYFFKKVTVEDTDIISLFRAARPIAIVIAPPLAALIIAAGSYQTLYLALAVILLCGLRYSLTLEDTM